MYVQHDERLGKETLRPSVLVLILIPAGPAHSWWWLGIPV